MPQPLPPMSAVTELLMRSSTEVSSRFEVMSWLVAYSAASSSPRHRLSSMRRRCSMADASGGASSAALSTSSSSKARCRAAVRATAPNTPP